MYHAFLRYGRIAKQLQANWRRRLDANAQLTRDFPPSASHKQFAYACPAWWNSLRPLICSSGLLGICGWAANFEAQSACLVCDHLPHPAISHIQQANRLQYSVLYHTLSTQTIRRGEEMPPKLRKFSGHVIRRQKQIVTQCSSLWYGLQIGTEDGNKGTANESLPWYSTGPNDA